MSMYEYPRASVLREIASLLEPIGEKTFLDTRPSTSGGQLQTYTVYRLPNGIRERGDTYQTAKLHVYLFARDRYGQTEDAFRLEEMQQTLCSLCPCRRGPLTVSRPVYLSGGADAGFHYLLFQLSLTVGKSSEPFPLSAPLFPPQEEDNEEKEEEEKKEELRPKPEGPPEEDNP